MSLSQLHARPGAERLLAAAEELLLAEGVMPATREVTRAAGMNSGAVNYYFGSRDALMAAIVQRLWDDVAARRATALEQLRAARKFTTRDLVSVPVNALLDLIEAEGDDAQRWIDAVGTLVLERGPALAFVRYSEADVMWRTMLRETLAWLPDTVFDARFAFAGELLVTATRTPVDAAGASPITFEDRADDLIDFVTAGLEAPLRR